MRQQVSALLKSFILCLSEQRGVPYPQTMVKGVRKCLFLHFAHVGLTQDRVCNSILRVEIRAQIDAFLSISFEFQVKQGNLLLCQPCVAWPE